MSLLFSKSKPGEMITLQRQDVKVEKCGDCRHLMVNLDADELRPGDLVILKRKGVWISNPETEDLLCVKCEFEEPEPSTFGAALSSWFDDDDDDDDSSFFSSTPTFGGGSSGFGGGFGGFGGGSFSGGRASRGF